MPLIKRKQLAACVLALLSMGRQAPIALAEAVTVRTVRVTGYCDRAGRSFS
ncbi:hypothetical protein [Janthinobacterium sp. SUN073]|uniref:hypothetical protein n=1 Tax=Janthinobacterium sp. SUN073 TaxID=3004102 RepID=UPI0025B22F44|nr:hypothetical protein [Janthinobacterium sp. SUN073]